MQDVSYGIYDLVHNHGCIYVGTSHDTAAFAVAAIVRWFERKDRPKFADETKILILSDSGGSNSYRARNWKYQLQQQLADQFNVEVMVCHYPSGASKWNPIEHRLFSFISLNWAGKPLRSLCLMTALIRGTTTSTGLIVKAAQQQLLQLSPQAAQSALNSVIDPELLKPDFSQGCEFNAWSLVDDLVED